MKYLAVFCILSVAALTFAEEEKYTTKFDDVNLEQIYKSPRLLDNYYKCMMDVGKCTPDAAELKKILPDALETECTKCSEVQKEKSREMIVWLVNNKPEMWSTLMNKYDPDKVYRVRFENLAKEAGIDVIDVAA